MKTEVYSWRVSTDLKSELEREARLRKKSVASVLDMAVREWLKKSAATLSDDDEQRRLHEAAESCIGTLEGGDPYRSENAGKTIRERLARRYGR